MRTSILHSLDRLHRADYWADSGAISRHSVEVVPGKTASSILLLPLLCACAGPVSSGAVAPIQTSMAASLKAPSDSPLLIPENIPPAAATAIFEYFRLFNLALETGRTGDLEEFVASDCPCLNPVPAIHAIYHDGFLIGAKYRVERITLVSLEESKATIQVQSVRDPATQVVASTGERKILPRHRNVTDFILENIADIWFVMSSKDPQ